MISSPDAHSSFSMTRTYFFSAKKYAKNSSLKTFDTMLVPHRATVKNFEGDKRVECKTSSISYFIFSAFRWKHNGTEGSNRLIFFRNSLFKVLMVSQPRPIYSVTANTSLQVRLISPYLSVIPPPPAVISTVAQNPEGLCEAISTSFISKFSGYAVRPIRLHFVPLPGKPGHGKVTGGLRDKIIKIATAELGVKESTGNNDGPRVEQYLAYTGLGKHHEWCASFISWCYGEAGLSAPRNPWSPALFPKARLIDKNRCQAADVFGIYGATAKRINHVGLVKEKQGHYIISIEGNSNNRVESRRRHLRTVHVISDWVDE